MNKLCQILLHIVFLLSLPLVSLGQTNRPEASQWSLCMQLGGYARIWALGVETPRWANMSVQFGGGYQSKRWYLPARFQYFWGQNPHKALISFGGIIEQDRLRPNNPDTYLYLGLGGAYRYEPTQKRLWFQLGFVQLWQTDPTPYQFIVTPGVWIPSIELSLGYRL